MENMTVRNRTEGLYPTPLQMVSLMGDFVTMFLGSSRIKPSTLFDINVPIQTGTGMTQVGSYVDLKQQNCLSPVTLSRNSHFIVLYLLKKCLYT